MGVLCFYWEKEEEHHSPGCHFPLRLDAFIGTEHFNFHIMDSLNNCLLFI